MVSWQRDFNEIIVNKVIGRGSRRTGKTWSRRREYYCSMGAGAFEIPLTAQKMAKSGKYDAVICVGAVYPWRYFTL